MIKHDVSKSNKYTYYGMEGVGYTGKDICILAQANYYK